MKAGVISVIALGAVLLIQTGCTKAEQTKPDRLKQIDAQLANWVSTGRPEDAQKRGALKAERALLAADLGYSTSTFAPVSAPVVAATPVNGMPNTVGAPVSKENRWEPMAGDSRWMDTTRHGETHGGTTYRGGRVHQSGTNYNNTYATPSP